MGKIRDKLHELNVGRFGVLAEQERAKAEREKGEVHGGIPILTESEREAAADAARALLAAERASRRRR